MKKSTLLFYFFIPVHCYLSLHAMEQKALSLDIADQEQSSLHKIFIRAIVEGIYATWIHKINGTNTEEVCDQVYAYLALFPPDLAESAKQKFVMIKAQEMASERLQCKKIYDCKTKDLTAVFTDYDGRQSTHISNWLTLEWDRRKPKGKSPWLLLSFEGLLEKYVEVKAKELTLKDEGKDKIWEDINEDGGDKKVSCCSCTML